jgi:hypothetical protein
MADPGYPACHRKARLWAKIYNKGPAQAQLAGAPRPLSCSVIPAQVCLRQPPRRGQPDAHSNEHSHQPQRPCGQVHDDVILWLRS